MKATCHCTAITITAPTPAGPLNECPCGVCSRYGAIWAYYDLSQVSVAKQDGVTTQTYTHGKGNIAFHFCERCKGLMYWWPVDEVRIPRMGINARMVVDKHDLDGVEVVKSGPRKAA